MIWIFNFFYFFYMGGVWERMIGVIWCILDVLLLGLKGKNFIYEVFSIMMVEVIVIMNFRLIIMILSDLDMFFVLSFVILLN